MTKTKIERRSFGVDNIAIETRADESTMIVGHAAVFNKLSQDLGGFREKINPGAFANAIKTDDVRALFNHDPNLLLGRTKSKTLRLSEDKTGLKFEIDVANTTAGRDLMESVKRGDIDQASFGFSVNSQSFEDAGDGETAVRTLEDVNLFDVSPVVFPAYPDTDVATREYRAWTNHNEKGKPMAKKEKRGAGLAALLNRRIDVMLEADEDLTKEDVQESIGQAAGISASTVGAILAGEIDCPPLDRLRGFATALSISLASIQTAAESDGCEYDDEGRSISCPSKIPTRSELNRRLTLSEKRLKAIEALI